jgi:NAD(P)-dependent dehydrogenase (short-subunit alcohol dehydrogenase family)
MAAVPPARDEGVVIVAGGSGGVGSAICTAFAAAGKPVVLTYFRNSAKAEELCAELKSKGVEAQAHQLDLRDSEAVRLLIQSTASRFGVIHSVIYAAGPAFEMTFVSGTDPKAWADVFATDVNGCFNLLNAALTPLRQQRSGCIVALSTCALRRIPKGDVLSAAPKAAVDMLIRCIAKEEGRYGIRANTVELGFINAGLAAHAMKHLWTSEMIDKFRTDTPLRRFGEADEVADAVIFLCSRKAAFITGQALAVDGGIHL